VASDTRATASILFSLTLLLCACHPTTSEAPPSAEAKSYVRNLALTEVGMKATENYAGQILTEIVGTVTNKGDKTVNVAEVLCVFYDPSGQAIFRERAPLVKKPLKPGEARGFRLPFDAIPANWNNQMPQLVIARIELI
jgi:hypothetical protein